MRPEAVALTAHVLRGGLAVTYRLLCDMCHWSVRIDMGSVVVEIERGTEYGVLEYECPNCLSQVQRELNPAALDGLIRCGARIEWVSKQAGSPDTGDAASFDVAGWIERLYDEADFTEHLVQLREALGFD